MNFTIFQIYNFFLVKYVESKGQVSIRPFFCPRYFPKRTTYSESALNSASNDVKFNRVLKKKFSIVLRSPTGVQ
jgi:hypothetical protein